MIEVMVASAVGAIVLTAVLSTFLFVGRSGVSLTGYTELERQARGALLQFGTDSRQASGIAWTNANTLQLTGEFGTITYTYDATAKQLTRSTGGASRSLATNIASFSFRAFAIDGNELPLATSPGTVGASTKMVQLQMTLVRTHVAAAKATESVVSARYVLRNKDVT